MAITFTEENKRLKYLFVVLAVIILIAMIIFGRTFFSKETIGIPPLIEVKVPTKKIEIDFGVFKSPFLEKLQAFEPIPPFEGEIGRNNPFVSSTTSTTSTTSTNVGTENR